MKKKYKMKLIYIRGYFTRLLSFQSPATLASHMNRKKHVPRYLHHRHWKTAARNLVLLHEVMLHILTVYEQTRTKPYCSQPK